MVRWAMFACVLLSCTLSSTVLPERIVWDEEPTVGTEDPELVEPLRWALSQWGWGRLVLGCSGADICVSRGAIQAGDHAAGRAHWAMVNPDRCTVNVLRPERSAAVIAHELGHCYGLGHSRHPHSVMYYPMEQDRDHFLWVTYDDQEALERLRNGSTSNRRRLP